MKSKYRIGDIVRLSEDAKENECYAKFEDATLRITHVATRYMPAAEFFSSGKPNGYHPGFDSEARCALYDLEQVDGQAVPCSLYEWELVAA